jgi:hypothetical protein
MGDVRRKKAGHPNTRSAVESLTRAIAFHRATLATPVDDHFVTPEHLRQMPLPPEPAPEWRQAGQFVITRAMCTVEVPAGERAPILAAVRWPLAAILTLRHGKHIRPILAQEIYILSSPLTDSERTELRTRQDRQLRDFDACVAQTRPTLLRLAEDGADPLFVLSVLVRYMPIRGTEVPKGESIVFRSREFDVRVLGDRTPRPLAPLADWNGGRTDKLPLRLDAAKTRPAQPRPPRRRGPAETAPSIGMALLAEHFATTTRHTRTHVSDIAALVRVWAPWIRGDAYLTGKHVYNRVRRIRESPDFRLVARHEKIRSQAEAALCATHFASP